MMLMSSAMADVTNTNYDVTYTLGQLPNVTPKKTDNISASHSDNTFSVTETITNTYTYSNISATATKAKNLESIVFYGTTFQEQTSSNESKSINISDFGHWEAGTTWTITNANLYNQYKSYLEKYISSEDLLTYEEALETGYSFQNGEEDEYDNLYFRVYEYITNRGKKAYQLRLINEINVTIQETTIKSYTYTPNAIAAGLIDGNTNTKVVTIASTITSIAPGAFKGSTSLINISNNSSAFTVEDNILYNAAKTTVIAAGAGVTGTITLPSSVTTVYDYAFANCSNLTVVTTATTIGEHQGSTRIGSENSVFDESDLKITKSGNGLIVTGEVASSNINNIWSDYTKSSICYVDFTGSTVHGSVTITNNGNPNCLFFFKAGDKASGTNVVVDEKCATMTFNESYGFHSPHQFTVTGTTKYTRAAALTAGQWSTVCLPFRGTSTNGLTFGYLKSFNNNNLTFLKTTDSRVEGGIIMAENGGTSFTFSDVIVPITNSSNQYTKSVDGATSVGNLIATNYGEAAATFPGNNIYTVSGGKLVICSGTVQWRAYRAYFAISQSSKAPAMRVEEEDGNIVELGTAIDLIEVAPKVEVNIASIEGGLSLTTQEAGRVTVYSMDGKKMFDGIVEGSKNLLLNKGIYAINNKKVIVK